MFAGIFSRGLLLVFLLANGTCAAAEPPAVPAETADEVKRRHECVAERRKGTGVICHRGASEFAHENTLEAFFGVLRGDNTGKMIVKL